MRSMLIPLFVMLTACPVTVVDSPPCTPCEIACDDTQTTCKNCKAENCPDMADE